jgi:hypothetical protein
LTRLRRRRIAAGRRPSQLDTRPLLVTLLALAACSGGNDTDTRDACGPNGECPAGFVCEPSTKKCVRGGATPDAPPPDAAVPDAPGCPAPTHGPTMHAAAHLTADETWTADTSPHLVLGAVQVDGSATLTIEACAQVQLAGAALFAVGQNGATSRLVVAGQAGRPVTMAARDPKAPWSYILAEAPGKVSLAYADLSGGGVDKFKAYATIYATGSGQPPLAGVLQVDHVTVSGSQGPGVVLAAQGGFAAGSTALTISGAGALPAALGAPVQTGVQEAGTLPSGTYTGNRVDSIIVDGDTRITQDLTIGDHGVPYDVTMNGNAWVQDATLTLGPGVTWRLGNQGTLTVGVSGGAGGAIIADGSDAAPVRIIAQPGTRWSELLAQYPGTMTLRHAILDGGGDNRFNQDASLVAWGDGVAPVKRNLDVEHVAIRGSQGAGVVVSRWAGFAAGATDLTVTGGGSGANFHAAAQVQTPGVQYLPTGAYTGNAEDAIYLEAVTVTDHDTIVDRGVPYVLPLGLRVSPPDASSTATLTVEAGVTMRFGAGSALTIGTGAAGAARWPGALVAVGTTDRPIVFTGTTAQNGFWRGLVYAGAAVTGNEVGFARIEYAGADCSCVGFTCASSANGAVLIFTYRPDTAFIHDTTFAHISGHGVSSAWSSTLDGPDFKPSNLFTDVSGCEQARWAPACPSMCY